MEPMVSLGEKQFSLRFEKSVRQFHRFLCLPEPKSDREVLQACIEINLRSSTTQGIRGVPDLIAIKQVYIPFYSLY